MSEPITRLNPPTLPDAGKVGYSQISIAEPGRLAFVSGQVAWRADGDEIAPDSLDEQSRIATSNAKAALEAIGASAKDIVLARIYVVDLTPDRLGVVMPHIHALFDGTQPSVTGIGVAALAAPNLHLEIEMIVRVPS